MSHDKPFRSADSDEDGSSGSWTVVSNPKKKKREKKHSGTAIHLQEGDFNDVPMEGSPSPKPPRDLSLDFLWT